MSDVSQHKIQILIAESHELIRMGLRLLFDNHPAVRIVGELDRLDNLHRLANQHCPDVVLLDWCLINVHGIDQIPRLMETCPHCKILIFVDNTEEQILLDFLHLGIVGIFARHQSTELLLKAIHAVHGGEVWFDRQTTNLFWQTQRGQQTATTAPDADANTRPLILTKRECSIACMACKGFSAKKIGQQLFISEKTVRNQLTTIYQILEVDGQVDLCLKAAQLNFCQLPGQSKDWDNCPNKKR